MGVVSYKKYLMCNIDFHKLAAPHSVTGHFWNSPTIGDVNAIEVNVELPLLGVFATCNRTLPPYHKKRDLKCPELFAVVAKSPDNEAILKEHDQYLSWQWEPEIQEHVIVPLLDVAPINHHFMVPEDEDIDQPSFLPVVGDKPLIGSISRVSLFVKNTRRKVLYDPDHYSVCLQAGERGDVYFHRNDGDKPYFGQGGDLWVRLRGDDNKMLLAKGWLSWAQTELDKQNDSQPVHILNSTTVDILDEQWLGIGRNRVFYGHSADGIKLKDLRKVNRSTMGVAPLKRDTNSTSRAAGMLLDVSDTSGFPSEFIYSTGLSDVDHAFEYERLRGDRINTDFVVFGLNRDTMSLHPLKDARLDSMGAHRVWQGIKDKVFIHKGANKFTFIFALQTFLWTSNDVKPINRFARVNDATSYMPFLYTGVLTVPVTDREVSYTGRGAPTRVKAAINSISGLGWALECVKIPFVTDVAARANSCKFITLASALGELPKHHNILSTGLGIKYVCAERMVAKYGSTRYESGSDFSNLGVVGVWDDKPLIDPTAGPVRLLLNGQDNNYKYASFPHGYVSHPLGPQVPYAFPSLYEAVDRIGARLGEQNIKPARQDNKLQLVAKRAVDLFDDC